MKRIPEVLGLSSEAHLFDSKLYILKAMVAITAGYFVGRVTPIVKMDMISLLLGIMYNLESINTAGIRSGVDQLLASTIGAACTGILVQLIGFNALSIALAMGLTIYVSLKINWRIVSPVAIFTSIYMTQYVQLNSQGLPSILLTFRLRIMALATGIAIAVVFNYIFSFIYYRKMAYKRLEFAKGRVITGLEYTLNRLQIKDSDTSRNRIMLFTSIMDDLEMVYKDLEVMKNETKYFFNIMNESQLKCMMRITKAFMDINHLGYSINYYFHPSAIDTQYSGDDIRELSYIVDTLNETDFVSLQRRWSKLDMRRTNESHHTTRVVDEIRMCMDSVKDEIQRLCM